MRSIAEFYGWVQQQEETPVISECSQCGGEIKDQRGSVIYECEHCMNNHEE